MRLSDSSPLNQVDEQTRRLGALSKALCLAWTSEQAADAILREAMAATLSQKGCLALLDSERGEFETRWHHGYALADVPSVPNRASGILDPVYDAVREGRSLFFESRQALDSHYPNRATHREADGIEATVALLLVADGQPLGVLELGWSELRSFMPQDHLVLQMVGDMCALALARVHFHAKTEQERAERRRAEEANQQLNLELEQRVIARTAQLQAAVEELDAFTYSVSHDLRAPLRAIDGFSRILLEDFAPDLPANAQRHLLRVRANAQNMGNLIDDLLAFSRLNRQPLHRQQVAPGQIVSQALELLSLETQGRDFRLKVDDLPPCVADPTLLRQVFVNLLSNALKFTRRCDPASIEVGAIREGEECHYFVRDNGVGFDMQYYDKLFGVFQRLHRAEDYEGTGVGLALVQRIIRRHGGRIWAEAAPNQGATFYFTVEQGERHD